MISLGRRAIGTAVTAITWMWAATVVSTLAGLAVTWLAGWQLHPIDSASMAPSVPRGSLAVVAPAEGGGVEVGDVVVFRDPLDTDRRVMHRVIGAASADDGRRYYETRGDANATPDPVLIPTTAVEGRLAWHVPRLGGLLSAVRPPAGLLLLGGAPLAGLVLSEAASRRRRRHGAQAASGAAA